MNSSIDFVKRVGYFLSARGKKSNSDKNKMSLQAFKKQVVFFCLCKLTDEGSLY